jgi:hypothetical protein
MQLRAINIVLVFSEGLLRYGTYTWSNREQAPSYLE